MIIDGWQYFHLKHFFESLPQPVRSTDNLLPMEKLSLATDRRKGISAIYKMLMEGNGRERPPYISKWEEELGTQVNDSKIGKILRMAFVTSIDSNTIEISFKSLARWYITPDKAHKFQKETSQFCWRGCSELGTIWWTCPKIRSYWREVKQIIKDITKVEVAGVCVSPVENSI